MLPEKIIEQIVRIVRSRKEPEKIVLYGSRGTGEAQKTSDIDIAIFGKDWNSTDVNIIRSKLEEEVKTVLKFDVIHFESIVKNSLKDNILKEGVILYESGQ